MPTAYTKKAPQRGAFFFLFLFDDEERVHDGAGLLFAARLAAHDAILGIGNGQGRATRHVTDEVRTILVAKHHGGGAAAVQV